MSGAKNAGESGMENREDNRMAAEAESGMAVPMERKKTKSAPENVRVRIAAPEDGAELLEIYRPYVERTAVTFEYEVPTAEEFAGRIARVLERYPYLAAEGEDGRLLGYAYAAAFHKRAACGWAVETSIYIRMDQRGRGIGRLLYHTLENILILQGVRNMNASIACPETEDEFLTRDSLRFHERFQYRMVGEFHQCGYKFRRWYNLAWMEKHIGPHGPDQPPVRPFREVRKQVEEELERISLD